MPFGSSLAASARFACNVVAAVAALGSVALAQDEAPAARVGLTVAARPAGCPNAAALAARTAHHLGHDPFIVGHHNPGVQVSFVATPNGFGAELHLVGAPSFKGRRSLDASVPDCADLTEPVAVILAMAFDDALTRHAIQPSRLPPEAEADHAPRAQLAPTLQKITIKSKDSAWRLALGPTLATHAFEAPRISVGGGLGLRLSHAALAFELGLRLSASLADGDTPTAVIFAATPRVCWAPGFLDVCAGVLVGFRAFDATTLTPLDPPATTVDVAATLALGVRLDAGFATLRPALELALPLVRPRLTHDADTLWTAPAFFGGLSLTIFFDTATTEATAATR